MRYITLCWIKIDAAAAKVVSDGSRYGFVALELKTLDTDRVTHHPRLLICLFAFEGSSDMGYDATPAASTIFPKPLSSNTLPSPCVFSM